MEKILEAFLCIMGLVLVFALAGEVLAQTPRDFHGARVIQHDGCRDQESGDHGHCYLVEQDGIHLIFHDEEGARFIRRLREDGTGYDTIWHRDGEAPPPGISL